MTPLAGLLARTLARVEPRHWVGVGASVALHLGVILGWRPDPSPEPQPISFEIVLEPPAAQVLEKPKAAAKKAAAKKLAKQRKAQRLAEKTPTRPKTRPEPAKREAHQFDADWRAETQAAKDAPTLALPDATTLGLPVATPGAAQAAPLEASLTGGKPPSKRVAAAGATAATGESSPGLSEPGIASVGSESARPAETGLALAQSSALSASQAVNPTSGSAGAQANTSIATLTNAAGGAGGAGGGSEKTSDSANLQATAVAPAALGAVAGAGMQAALSNTPNMPNGVEAQAGRADAVRLAVSNELTGLAVLPAGAGAIAAGSHLAARAAASVQGSAPVDATLGASAGGGTLKGSPIAAASVPATARSGAVQADYRAAGVSRAGRGQEAAGRLGMVATVPAALPGAARGASGPARTGQGGTTVALAPGEPGSSPKYAVALQPVVASLANPYLAARPSQAGFGGESGAGVGRAVSRAPTAAGSQGAATPFAGSAAGGGAAIASARAPTSAGGPAGISAAPGQTASAAVLDAAREAGRAPVVLHAAQPIAVKVVRPDSEIQHLDVLAPSNYCPLPLPGHNQPDNRAPQPNRLIAEQPAYALDNPSIHYPVLANIRGVEGRVTVRVEVLADGRPGKMWLKQSSGSGILDQDAQAQLKNWRFVPARKGGQPVAAWIDVPVMYRLSQARP